MMLGCSWSGFGDWGLVWGTGVLVGCWMGAGVGCRGGSGFVAWLKIVARVLMASICLSLMLEKGALGVGFCNACASSAAAVVAFSVEEGNGMTQLWGKNSTVSAILSWTVLLTYTWWQR